MNKKNIFISIIVTIASVLLVISFTSLRSNLFADGNGIVFNTDVIRGVRTVNNPATDTLTGTVTSLFNITSVELSNGKGFTRQCNVENIEGEWSFTCQMSNLPDNGTYPYKVTATDINDTKYEDIVYINNRPDIPVYLLTFDQTTDWQNEVINGFSTNIVGTNTTRSTDSMYGTSIGGSIDFTYPNQDQGLYYYDSGNNLLFNESDSHFKVETSIKTQNPTDLNGKTIISKIREDNRGYVWYLSINENGGISCSVILSDNSSLYLETNEQAIIESNTWTKIGCEWQKNGEEGILSIYNNDKKLIEEKHTTSAILNDDIGYLIINGDYYEDPLPLYAQNSGDILMDEIKITDLSGISQEDDITLNNTTRGVFTSTNPETDTLTGVIYSDVLLSSVLLDNGSLFEESCSIGNQTPDSKGWEFSCPLSNIHSQGAFPYYVRATASDGFVFSKMIYIYNATGVPTYLWSFDQKDDENWLYENINGYQSTVIPTHVQIMQSEDIFYGQGLSANLSDYYSIDQAILCSDVGCKENLNFSNDDSRFKTELKIKRIHQDGYTNSRPLLTKLAEDNGNPSWQIMLKNEDNNGGMRCYYKFTDGSNITLDISDTNGTLLPLNEWRDIACEWDATTRKVSAYIDGLEVGYTYAQGTAPILDGSGPLIINSGAPDGGYSNKVLIDEVKITNLTGQESIPEGIHFNNVLKGVFNFNIEDPEYSELRGFVNTSLNIDNISISNENNSFNTECTTEVNKGVLEFSCPTSSLPTIGVYPYIVSVTATNNTVYNEIVYINNRINIPTYLWTFDQEGENWTDEVMHGFNTSIIETGQPINIQSEFTKYTAGKSADLRRTDSGDQTLQCTDCNDYFSFSNEDSKFKVEAVVNRANEPFYDGDRALITKYSDENSNIIWRLGIKNNSNGMYCQFNFSDNTQVILDISDENTPLIPIEEWHKITCEWDATKRIIAGYIDDERIGYTIVEGNATLQQGNGPLIINGDYPGGGYSNKLYLDEIKITDLTGVKEQTPIGNIQLNNTTVVISENSYTLEGSITDSSNISNIQYRKYNQLQGEDENWVDNCTCTDGNCDTNQESFSCNIENIESLRNVYEIRYNVDNSPITSDKYGILEIVKISDNSLVSWWNFDKRDEITDKHQNNLDGTIIGFSNNSKSTYSGTLTNIFDGIGHISIDNSSNILNFDGENDEFTIDLLIKPYEGLNTDQEVMILNSQDSTWSLGMYITTEGNYNIFGRVKSDTYETIGISDPNAYLQQGQWNHIIFKFSNQDFTSTLKVNDNDLIVSPRSTRYKTTGASNNITIGKKANNNQGFIGEIDDILIFNSADTKSPEIIFTPLESPLNITNPNQEFEITIKDESGVESFQYLFYPSSYAITENSINELEWSTIEQPTEGSWGEKEVVVRFNAPNLEDNNWYLYTQSVDSNGFRTLLPDGYWYTSGAVTSPSSMPFYYFIVESVDELPPKIYAQSIIPNKTVDRNPGIRGYVKDDTSGRTSNISLIEYRLEKGHRENDTWVMEEEIVSWTGIDSLGENATFDSTTEEFYLVLQNLTIGDYRVEIRAEDQEGNNTEDNNTNYSEIFTIYEIDHEPDTSILIKEENFLDHQSHDLLFSDAVWGNGILRLRQKIDFEQSQEFYTNSNDFGSYFGAQNTVLNTSIDGNLWLVLNDDSLLYYNVTTKEYTNYSPNINFRTKEGEIDEFELNGRRYLAIYRGDATIIYDINNTPNDISDDTFVSYSERPDFGVYRNFKVLGTDTRNGRNALYATINYSDGENFQDYLMWIDTKGTVLDVSDDTYVKWGNQDGIFQAWEGAEGILGNDITAAYFDQDLNIFITGSYHRGINVCTDGGDPENKENDSCRFYLMTNAFSIIKDTNNYYWIAGDNGIVRINSKNTEDILDDEHLRYIKFGEEDDISDIQFVKGEYPVGDEIWYMTRTGYIKGVELNNTYDDFLDDTKYTYRIENQKNRIGAVGKFFLSDKNTMYVLTQGAGVQKISLTRSFDEINKAEFLPTPPDGVLAVNYIDLDQVLGTVIGNNIHTLNDLVTYEVSNDSGVTWYPIQPGGRVEFPTTDYKLKLRITLRSGSTPVIESVRLSYITYPDKNEDQCNIKVENQKPVITEIQPTANQQFNITFTPIDDNEEVSKYVLQYGLSETAFTLGSVDIPANATKYTLSNIEENKTYYIRMKAVTNCTESDWSTTLSAINNGKKDQKPVVQQPPVREPKPIVQQPPVIEPDPIVNEDYNDNESDSENNNENTIIDIDNGNSKGANIFAKIAEYISNTFQSISQGIKSLVEAIPVSPESSRTATIVTGATLIGTSATVISLGAYYPKALLIQAINTILVLFGVKRRKPYGTVYNSITKEPLNRAILRIFDKNNTLISTEVTDIYGVFSLDLKEGEYKIEVNAKNFNFPSQIVVGKTDGIYGNIYKGDLFVYKDEISADFSIPMDPIDKNAIEYSKAIVSNRISNILIIIQNVLIALGIIFAIYTYLKAPSVISFMILMLYLLFLIITLVISRTERAKLGILYDQLYGTISGIRIGLRELEFNTIYAERITNEEGKYRFIVPGGDYNIEILDPEYKLKSDEKTLITGKKNNVLVVNKDLEIQRR